MGIIGIKNAFISVSSKEGLVELSRLLRDNKVNIYATHSTFKFLSDNGIDVNSVKDITNYEPIIGGRVKTLHPKIFGGIMRTDSKEDIEDVKKYGIVEFDLVVVDLYPFEDVYNDNDAKEKDLIESIDIGGVSLMRAAAKNFNKVVVLSSPKLYPYFMDLYKNDGQISLEKRREFAKLAFERTFRYDIHISNFFGSKSPFLSYLSDDKTDLRYGENPHQKAIFFGKIEDAIEKISGNRDLSYNNLLDIDVAINIINDFDQGKVFTIIKHLNPCGLAIDSNLNKAFNKALQADTVSAFGGIFASNSQIDLQTAENIDKHFFEILVAPSFDKKAIDILTKNKRRILVVSKKIKYPNKEIRSLLNGLLQQDKDNIKYQMDNLEIVSKKKPTESEKKDLIFAMKASKHIKSNSIAIAKNLQLLASGKGQSSRIDSIKHAIDKANAMNIKLEGAVMASEAFFPFYDSIEYVSKYGIKSVIQPGGSIRDKESIDYCNDNQISMVFTKIRHFKH